MVEQATELKGKNILVTGGAGFIGSHIVDRLAPDNNVFLLDNLFNGSLDNLSKSKDMITFVKGDIRDKELVAETVARVEYIFHLAAHVGNIRSLKDPYFDMEVNIKGMLNLLEACRSNPNLKRLVYSSSGAIFGEAKYLPIDEEHPLNPESPYAVSKLAAEKYAFAYHKVYGLPVTAVRYFNAYGPRQDSSEYANAVSIFLSRTLKGEPLTVFGDGEQTRDFIFISDIVNANVLAATRPAAIGEIFNISTGEVHSIKQLIEIIREVTGKEVPYSHQPFRKGEVKHSKANIDKAKKLLGYRPQTGLKEGIRLTWEAMGRGGNKDGRR
ncbi:MAG: SDR family oxidoreductase [Chloroflexi bacterium]|nr:SDR family oxidoreductase [Chloroflexota bacterium]